MATHMGTHTIDTFQHGAAARPRAHLNGADMTPLTRVLFVCLGNICRSPLAHGVMRAQVAQRGLAVEVDSAGTGGWHAGDPPDWRAKTIAQSRDCSCIRRKPMYLTPIMTGVSNTCSILSRRVARNFWTGSLKRGVADATPPTIPQAQSARRAGLLGCRAKGAVARPEFIVALASRHADILRQLRVAKETCRATLLTACERALRDRVDAPAERAGCLRTVRTDAGCLDRACGCACRDQRCNEKNGRSCQKEMSHVTSIFAVSCPYRGRFEAPVLDVQVPVCLYSQTKGYQKSDPVFHSFCRVVQIASPFHRSASDLARDA